MSNFEIRFMNGDKTIIEAENEKEARHLAMVERYGPPVGIYKLRIDGKYWGVGLDVIRV